MAEQIKSLKTGIKYKDTPIGRIPVDWEVVRLDDVCDEIYRYPTYYNIQYVDQENGVPEIRGELINKDGTLSSDTSQYRYISKDTSAKYPRTILQEGDFVLSVRGTMGKIGHVSSNLNGSNMTANLMRIAPNRDKIWSAWLKQVLLHDLFQSELNSAASATTIKTIKSFELKSIKLALPPFIEQKKIAEILSTVDEAIEKTDQVIEKTKEAKKGLMQRLLTRGIGHKKFKKTEIGEIPIEWNIDPLIAVLVLQRGFDLPIQRRIKGQYPILASNGIIDYHQEFKVKGPGIVTGRSGTLGKVHYIESNYWPLNTTLYVKEFYNNDPKFIYYFLQSLSTEKYGTGTGVPTLNRNILHKVKVAIPPLDEQIKVAEIISESDAEIEKGVSYRSDLERIKNGLMQVLLTGRIRVKA